MNIIFTILIALAGLIALLLIIALFLKKELIIVKSIVVNRSKPEVFDYVKHIKNQDNYSKWNMADPAMKKDYKGTDGTVGFVYYWDSNDKNVGKGEQEIKKISEGERIEMEIRFIKPFEGVAQVYMATETADLGTNVTWSFTNKMKYPSNVIQLFMNMEKMLGNDLQTGLNNLKNNLEKINNLKTEM
jgi:uncharacterized protein YndB with AHSA1/START domain